MSRGGQPDAAPASVEIGVAAGFRAGLSLAAAGDMDLARRAELPWRARLFASLGSAADQVRAVRQVHSRVVIRVDGCEPADGPLVEADGMVSDRSSLLLTVTVADCLPIFLADPRTGAFGLVHSGWKGTGIVVEAIHAMTSAFGSRAADIAVAIGPGIGPCCYAVPFERHERFRADFGDGSVQRGLDGSYRLDLRAANAALLEREGIGSIAIVADCTSCNPLLGSFRRQGPGFTRMLAFIGAGG
jgi:polyphenol oxidase